jgi:molybdate transport system regulatory protein
LADSLQCGAFLKYREATIPLATAPRDIDVESAMNNRRPFPQIHIRINLQLGFAFGPGKAELLENIAATGSISAAARQMRMSYKRAWQLVDDMNRSFNQPVINTIAGGAHGGGATLTDCGKRVVKAYRSMQKKIKLSATRDLAALARYAALA